MRTLGIWRSFFLDFHEFGDVLMNVMLCFDVLEHLHTPLPLGATNLTASDFRPMKCIHVVAESLYFCYCNVAQMTFIKAFAVR